MELLLNLSIYIRHYALIFVGQSSCFESKARATLQQKGRGSEYFTYPPKVGQLTLILTSHTLALSCPPFFFSLPTRDMRNGATS